MWTYHYHIYFIKCGANTSAGVSDNLKYLVKSCVWDILLVQIICFDHNTEKSNYATKILVQHMKNEFDRQISLNFWRIEMWRTFDLVLVTRIFPTRSLLDQFPPSKEACEWQSSACLSSAESSKLVYMYICTHIQTQTHPCKIRFLT